MRGAAEYICTKVMAISNRIKRHDDQFEPQAALGVDEIGQRLRGVADHLELAAERGRALAEFVLILEACVETLEVGPVPEDVRLFLDGDAPRTRWRTRSAADMLRISRRLPGRRPFSARCAAKAP